MKREVSLRLEKWAKKDKALRKPLVLQGARQVGKSWLLEELGKSCFEDYVIVNFEKMINLQSLFVEDFDIHRIIRSIEIATDKKIVSGKTLLILDEIQEAEKGVTSLKYFKEDAPDYHVAAAGSLLGVSLHKDESFPVGKVEFIDVYPMSFVEFLDAMGETKIAESVVNGEWKICTLFENKLKELLKTYYFVGGMPEAVATYALTSDFEQTRAIQQDLLRSYDNDFSKHAPHNEVPKIRMVWQSIVGQLSKENKKFIYGALRSGARAAEYENAIQWLVNAGMVIKVTRVTAGEIPLKGFEDKEAFKLYHLDVGLLSAAAGLGSKSILMKNEFFAQFKGALTEQYVCQQLQYILQNESVRVSATQGESYIHYWRPDTGISELDFLVQMDSPYGTLPVPIEVKAEKNLKAKSIVTFMKKYNPTLAIKTNIEPFSKKEDSIIVNLPLYLFPALVTVL